MTLEILHFTSQTKTYSNLAGTPCTTNKLSCNFYEHFALTVTNYEFTGTTHTNKLSLNFSEHFILTVTHYELTGTTHAHLIN